MIFIDRKFKVNMSPKRYKCGLCDKMFKTLADGLCSGCTKSRNQANTNLATTPFRQGAKKRTNRTDKDIQDEDGNSADDCDELSYCKKCKFLVKDNENAMCCESCDGWVHIGCCGMSLQKYKSIQAVSDIVHWFCEQCDKKVMTMLVTLNKLEARLDDLEDKIEVSIEKKIDDMLEERMLREEKKANLIVFGLHEAPPEVNGKDRLHFDIGELGKIQSIAGKELEINEGQISKAFRIGKLDTDDKHNPRPLCIKFKNVDDKYRILKGASLLKDVKENWLKNVGFSPDYTQLQRKKQKDAVMELKNRKSKGETDLIIRNFKVIKRMSPGRRGPLEA